jgi:hypothetical protein
MVRLPPFEVEVEDALAFKFTNFKSAWKWRVFFGFFLLRLTDVYGLSWTFISQCWYNFFCNFLCNCSFVVVRYILYLFTFVPHRCKDTLSLG